MPNWKRCAAGPDSGKCWKTLPDPHVHPLDYLLPRASSEGLSGGQRRLLAVTRALLLHPAILLLDEPTTGIDAIGRSQVATVLREACRGLTVLLVDHDMEFISHFADWVCCLEHGKFAEVGTPEELAAGRDYSENCSRPPKKTTRNRTKSPLGRSRRESRLGPDWRPGVRGDNIFPVGTRRCPPGPSPFPQV